MKAVKSIAVLVAVSLLAACATPRPVDPKLAAEIDRPLICKGKEQCDLYWQRALFYVNRNSPYKVQTATDSLIQTYSPTGGTTNLAFNVSKEPLEGGSWRLWVKVWCDNMFGCYPEVPQTMAAIKRYIREGVQ